MTTIKTTRLASLVTGVDVLVSTGFTVTAIFRPEVRRMEISGRQPRVRTVGNSFPNIGLPLFDCVREASS